MSDDWENEDFEPTIPAGGTVATDKWEGEDEEDEVKENWEDEEEEKKQAESGAYQRPKKKPLAERISEKGKAAKQQEEEKLQEKKELTPEEKLAERIRVQKLQEEADLKIAKGLFGIGDSNVVGIDSMYPETKEQFDQFGEVLKTKITFFESSKLYSAFVEKLIQDISLTLPPDDIKKIGIALNTLYHEKERLRKEQAKGQRKKKVKASIKVDKPDDLGLMDDATTGQYYDEDDDFI
uniref:Eukaryotic translation initiation factor 3 subunit J n=1 Tax=Arion vulgaris TaxID=1028688 RepID=A0A0B7BL25_9EUPU